MNGNKVEIAQVNTVDVNDVLVLQEQLEKAMDNTIKNKGLSLFALVITDILESDSVVLAVGEEAARVEQAFNVTLDNNTAVLKDVVSSKKQVVPNLQSAF